MIKVKGKVLKIARIKKGFSQVAAAKEVNINVTSYNMLENGKMGLKPATAKRITKFLEMNFDDLFEITGL